MSRSLDEVRRLVNSALRDPGGVLKLPNDDLDLLVRLLRDVRLHGTLAANLKQTDEFDALPQVVMDQLESAFVTAEARARVALWEMNRIAWATRDHPQIRIALMKGCAYITLGLPTAKGRIFADVDLLVAESDIGKVEDLLNRRGWKTRELSPYDENYYRRWTHEIPPLLHVEREVEIDIHHNVLPRTARLKPDASRIFGAIESLPDSKYFVLTDVDMALHAMTHLMFNDEMSDNLRDLVDIDGLLRHFSSEDSIFWERLLKRAGELDLRRPAYYALRFCNDLLDTPVPGEVLARVRVWAPPGPVNWLMGKLVPRALYPQHPEHPSRLTSFVRWLLYIRSHWIRMPPWLLAYHLAVKFYVTRIRREQAPDH